MLVYKVWSAAKNTVPFQNEMSATWWPAESSPSCRVTQLLTTFPVTVQAALAKQKSQYPGMVQIILTIEEKLRSYAKLPCQQDEYLYQHWQKSKQSNFSDIRFRFSDLASHSFWALHVGRSHEVAPHGPRHPSTLEASANVPQWLAPPLTCRDRANWYWWPGDEWQAMVMVGNANCLCDHPKNTYTKQKGDDKEIIRPWYAFMEGQWWLSQPPMKVWLGEVVLNGGSGDLAGSCLGTLIE